MEAELPDKKYYKIGEVSRITSLSPSVLRFWETEFKELSPSKSRTGQRLYTRHEVELLLEIKRLLYTERLTIDGARIRLSVERGKSFVGSKGSVQRSEDEYSVLIKEIREELRTIKTILA